MASCFMFGHADCPDSILPKLESCIESAVSKGILNFYVGNRGAFDRLAATAVKRVKQKHPGVCLYLLLAYHPAERPTEPSEGFDGTYYPLIDKVPRRFAIVRANEAIIATFDCGNVSNDTLYSVYPLINDDMNLYYLLGILNSTLLYSYYLHSVLLKFALQARSDFK